MALHTAEAPGICNASAELIRCWTIAANPATVSGIVLFFGTTVMVKGNGAVGAGLVVVRTRVKSAFAVPVSRVTVEFASSALP
jgi:hypothetical protein